MKLDASSLAHTNWECKYHIVFAPKYRRQIIYGKIITTGTAGGYDYVRELLLLRTRVLYKNRMS